MNTPVMKKVQQGFTLIELMIVVAIIGILAAVAIPAYQDYLARSQAAEAASLLGGLKTGIAEWYSTYGSVPSTSDLNATTKGKYVSSIESDIGARTYTATFKAAGSVNAKLATKEIVMTFQTSGQFEWNCSALDSPVRPTVCK